MSNDHNQQITTARFTGIWYLLLAVTGGLGFMLFHPQIFIEGDPEKTLTNLIEQESFARMRLLLELAVIITQALTAVWFYRLFRRYSEWAAWAIAGWGMANAIAIMISAISIGSAIDIATSTTLAQESQVELIELCSRIVTNSWAAGSIFFGLWLIPMGYVVIDSGRMPLWLGRTLFIGGFGYLLNTVLHYLGFLHPMVEMLVIPATIGELWMLGYLIIFGIRSED
ncbi:MAG: DUF4386 domain-containing protein [Flavobacteriales bacterium]